MQSYYKADAIAHTDEAGINITVRLWTANEDGYQLTASFGPLRCDIAAHAIMNLWRDRAQDVLHLLSAPRMQTPQEAEDAAARADADAEAAALNVQEANRDHADQRKRAADLVAIRGEIVVGGRYKFGYDSTVEPHALYDLYAGKTVKVMRNAVGSSWHGSSWHARVDDGSGGGEILAYDFELLPFNM